MFNGQGQWKKAEWVAFKTWVQEKFASTEQKLHLLRYKSAIFRRRLAHLQANLPPHFDLNARIASNLYDATGTKSSFQAEWKPQTVGSRPIVEQAHVKPSPLTGLQVTPIKDAFYREIRFLEYFEHLIQKHRFELEQIEHEIFWLESLETRLQKHIDVVDAQFKNPEFSSNLLDDDSLHQTSIYDPLNPRKLAFFEGLESDFQQECLSLPKVPNNLNPSAFDEVKNNVSRP